MKPPLSPDLRVLIPFDIISPSKYSPRHPDVALGRLDASQVDFVLCNQWWPADIAVLPFPLISTAHSSLFSCYEPPHQCWGNSKHLLVNRSSSRITLFYDMTLRSLGNLNILCLFRDVCKSYCPGHKGNAISLGNARHPPRPDCSRIDMKSVCLEPCHVQTTTIATEACPYYFFPKMQRSIIGGERRRRLSNGSPFPSGTLTGAF